MSTYLVPDSTINRIVTFAKSCRDGSDGPFEDAGYYLRAEPDAAGRLSADLQMMNAHAVSTRYKEPEAFDPIRYRAEFASTIQAYKAARTLLYQCSEGKIPQQPLYRALEQFANTLAHRMISAMPEYQRA